MVAGGRSALAAVLGGAETQTQRGGQTRVLTYSPRTIQDDMDWLEELLEQAVPVNPRLKHGEFHGQTALIWAVRCGNLPATEMLINAGADPFIPDEKYRDAW